MAEITFYREVRSKEAKIRNKLRFPPNPATFRHKSASAETIRHELFYASKALVLTGYLPGDRQSEKQDVRLTKSAEEGAE
jgi:hypothetical protein